MSTTDAAPGRVSPSSTNGSVNGNPSTSTLPPAAIELATKLYWAARHGDSELPLLTQALSAGLPANMTNDKGDSLLMLAAYHGQPRAVSLLLSHGADPNRLNDRGQSPLAGAVFKLESEVIEELLAGGADPEYGMPNAMECIGMFKQEHLWKEKFEGAPGRGKMGGRGLEAGTAAPDVNGVEDVAKTEGDLEGAYRKAHAAPES